MASIAAAVAYCPRDTRSTITLVDDRAVYCLVHEWKITPTPTLLPGVTPPPTRTLGPTVTPRPTRTPGYPGGIPLTPDGIETWVLHYTNEKRATVVLAPFVHDQAISKIAGRHSAMMSRHGYSHTVLGRGPTDRALASGYNCRAYRADGSYTYGLSENIHQLHRVTSWENRGAGWRPLGFAFATDQDILSLFSINVRLTVRQKCHLFGLRWYQMATLWMRPGTDASADSQRQRIS